MGFRKEKEVKRDNSGKPEESGLVYKVYPPFGQPQNGYDSSYEFKLKQLSAQLLRKNVDLERLRDYVTQLEEGEKGLIQELTKQLAIKDEEISRVASIYAKKEAENRKLSALLETNVVSQREHAEKIKAILVKKEAETKQLIDGLSAQLEKKNADITSLRKQLLEKASTENSAISQQESSSPHLELLVKEIERRKKETTNTEKLLLEEQRLAKEAEHRFRQQLTETRQHVEELKVILVGKDSTIAQLESAIEKKFLELEREAHKAKAAAPVASFPSYETEKFIEKLQKELKHKNGEISSLNEQLAKKLGSTSFTGSEGGRGHERRIEKLEQELEQSGSEIRKLDESLLEEQRLGKSMQSRLKEQLVQKSSQLEELKTLLIEKEKIVRNLETAFEKNLAAKEEQLRHFRQSAIKKPETHLHRELDELKSEIHIKEESSKFMAEEVAKLKEQAALLRKRLEERQRIYFESEKAYEELIAKLREQHDTRVKSFLQESSQKESALKIALEEERAKLQRETALMKEKETQIKETLQTFTVTSHQLLKLQGAGIVSEAAGLNITELLEKEKHLASKEEELKQLLASTETKIAELKEREAGIGRKEQMLLNGQEALAKELEILGSAGVEIGRSRQYIQQKLAQLSTFEQPQQRIQQPAEATEAPEDSFFTQTPRSGTELQTTVEEAPEENKIKPQDPAETMMGGRTVEEELPGEAAAEDEGFESIKPQSILKRAPKAGKEAGAIKSKLQQKKVKQTKLKPKAAAKLAAKQQKLPIKQPEYVTAFKTATVKPITKQPPKKTEQSTVKEMPIGAREAAGRAEQELFTEIGGYSELDEIKSIVDVGLQHGDSINQIRESLLTSGYSKQNIEKALGSVKK
ncbi:hypothetical protein HYY73_00975 [Candidatus Woesearchaeota archaeon]|nr:hypothetical protein [Candidatus Woesearchaeota archaeon]